MPMDDDGLIDLDLDEVDDGSDPLPENVYETYVKTVEKKQKDGSSYPYLNLHLKPLDDKFKSRTLFLTLSYHPQALWNMKRFAKAMGWKKGDKINFHDWKDKKVAVTVGTKADNNDPTVMRNEVKSPYHAL